MCVGENSFGNRLVCDVKWRRKHTVHRYHHHHLGVVIKRWALARWHSLCPQRLCVRMGDWAFCLDKESCDFIYTHLMLTFFFILLLLLLLLLYTHGLNNFTVAFFVAFFSLFIDYYIIVRWTTLGHVTVAIKCILFDLIAFVFSLLIFLSFNNFRSCMSIAMPLHIIQALKL